MCQVGYWSDWDPAADANGQFCTSDNCKTWGYTLNDPRKTSQMCETCWNNDDILDYENWPGKLSYAQGALSGRLTSEPFKLVGTECVLQCAPGFATNSYKVTSILHHACIP